MAGQAESASTSLKDDHVRHAHGLDKIIVAAASNGMILALDNVQGLPLWKTAAPYFHLRLVALLDYQAQDDSSSSTPPDLKVGAHQCCYRAQLVQSELTAMLEMQIMMIRTGDQGSVIILINPVNGKISSIEHVSMCVTHVQTVDHARSRAFLFAQVMKPFPEAIPVSIYPSSVIDGPHHDATVWAADAQTGESC